MHFSQFKLAGVSSFSTTVELCFAGTIEDFFSRRLKTLNTCEECLYRRLASYCAGHSILLIAGVESTLIVRINLSTSVVL